jgi:hypothetical protein
MAYFPGYGAAGPKLKPEAPRPIHRLKDFDLMMSEMRAAALAFSAARKAAEKARALRFSR